MKRPGIVSFNALLNLFFGVVFTFINGVVIAGSNPHAGGSSWHFWEWDWDVIKIIGPLTVLSVASIFVFFGLWRLRPWGRTLFNSVNIVLAVLVGALAVSGYEIESGTARIVLGILALVFVTAP
ncbi:MAG: hypothetical protein ACE5FC_09980, partial [Myxococcota bacterium]